ncbi:MAG: enoyl-CoA hydratase/isomerase family protein, partial [Pseudomonadota bacterium]
MTDGLATTDETHIRIAKAHAAGDVVLDRVETLNALTDDMRAVLKAALPDFARDPVIYAMVIRSASAKAFSAGGDVRQLVAQAKTDPA